MIRLHEYLDASGGNEYRTWFNGLDVAAATKVTVALDALPVAARPRLSPLVKAYRNTRLTSAQATEFISARMVIGLSSCWVAAQKSDRTRILRMPRPLARVQTAQEERTETSRGEGSGRE
jgi:hypothetical protein